MKREAPMPIEDKKPPFQVIPAKREIHSIDEMKSVSVAGWKPELVEQALAEAREDRLFDWVTSKSFTSTRR